MNETRNWGWRGFKILKLFDDQVYNDEVFEKQNDNNKSVECLVNEQGWKRENQVCLMDLHKTFEVAKLLLFIVFCRLFCIDTNYEKTCY